MFTEKNCLEVVAEGKKGKYEWEGAKAGTTYTSTTGTVVLKGSAGEITCTSSMEAGELTGPRTGTDKFTFQGCVLSVTKEPCSNTAMSGVVETATLATKLIDHGEHGLSGKEPTEGEIWMQYSSDSEGGVVSEFECSGIPFKMTGSVSAPVTPVNKAVKPKAGKPDFTAAFTETGGEQDLTTTFYNPITEKIEDGPSAELGTNAYEFSGPLAWVFRTVGFTSCAEIEADKAKAEAEIASWSAKEKQVLIEIGEAKTKKETERLKALDKYLKAIEKVLAANRTLLKTCDHYVDEWC